MSTDAGPDAIDAHLSRLHGGEHAIREIHTRD